MHGTRHDQILAALQSAAHPHGAIVDVVAFTSNAELLEGLRRACGPEHRIWPAQSAGAAVELLLGGRCGLLVVDLAALQSDAASFFENLHSQFPELILAACGADSDERALAPLIARGLIVQFLHKTESATRADVLLTTATQRNYELQHVHPIARTASRPSIARSRASLLILGALAVLSGFVAGVAWRSTGRSAIQEHAVLSKERQIAYQLGRARIAVVTGRLTEPEGESAAEYFRAVLAMQPDHAEARAGLQRIINALEKRFIEALDAHDAPAGAAAFNALQRAQPDHPGLDDFRKRLIALSRSLGPSVVTTSGATPTPATLR